MARSVFRVLVIGLMTVIGLGSLPALAGVVVSAVRILSTREIADEDDMCFWLHPTDLSRSTVISSDKKARSLFVYDLEGHVLQAIASPEPGNVDVRYGFPLGGREVDIVAFNDRETQRIRVYAVDPATRLLSRVDDDGILTGKNYGFTLYRSATSGRTYAFTGAKAETVVQEWSWSTMARAGSRASGRSGTSAPAASARAW
jgi:3-phytase